MKADGELDFRAIDRTAARWAARMEGGSLSGADREELRAWLEANPSHRWSFSHYQHVSAELDVALPALASAGYVEAPAAVDRRPFRRAGWALLGAAAVAVVAFAWRDSGESASQPARVVLTRAAERQSVQLGDGTRADLNAQTSLTVEFRDSERRVKLARGEALFAVAKDPVRPFVVETASGDIRVTGTVFNVRASRVDGLEVTVIEGLVEVRPQPRGEAEKEMLRLSAGDQVRVNGTEISRQRLAADFVSEVGAWREGRIVFAATRLDEALRRFAEYHGQSLTVAADVAGLRLGGRFSLDDLKGFLESLEEALPVLVVRDRRGAISVTGK